MDTSDQAGLPQDLARVRRRFEAWRSHRQRGERIPERLWTLAVRLVSRHGVSQTAMALHLDYYGLKERAETATCKRPSSTPAFVELPSPVMVGKRCLVELQNGAGASMRVEMVGFDTADVEALARSFWTAD
jgi:hypothetical protein